MIIASISRHGSIVWHAQDLDYETIARVQAFAEQIARYQSTAGNNSDSNQ